MFSFAAFVLIFTIAEASKEFCSFEASKSQLICTDFKSANNLDFKQFPQLIETLIIKADRSNSISIDNSLDLTSVNFRSSPTIKLQNFIGIDPFATTLRDSIRLNSTLEIRYTNWEFTRRFNCSDSGLNLIFSGLSLNEFYLNDPVFSDDLCPVLFKEMNVKRLRISASNRMNFVEKELKVYGIVIDELIVQNSYGDFINELSENEILFPAMFEHLKSIELNRVYVKRIDAASLKSLTKLKSLTVRQLDLETLLKSNTEWFSALNTHNQKLITSLDLRATDFFLLAFGIGAESRLNMEFSDSQICLFKDFPHKNLVVPVFYEEDYGIENSLACSCTVNWLFKDYNVFKKYIQLKGSFKFPNHCLNINQVLLDEQTDFCSNPTRLESCNETTTIEPETKPTLSIKNTTICFTNCSCTSQDSVELLECSDPLMTEVPSGLESGEAWSYVSFVGSGLKNLLSESFYGMRLVEAATVVVSGIQFFDDNLFENTNYTKSFRFLVKNSSLDSLSMTSPFQRTNFTELDFNECSLTATIVINGFIDANINELIIRNPNADSIGPIFRRGSLVGDINIKQFRIINAFRIFSKNSPTGYFAIDPLVMNFFMFKELEELEITNTFIDFIQPESLLPLKKLKTLRLENVGLKNVINAYFDRFQIEQIEFENEEVSLMANGNLKRIFLGHEESDSTWLDNESICYFAGLNVKEESTNVFIYDTLDYIDGIDCTCTVYWIYSRADINVDSVDEIYIPKCIKKLNTTENVRKMFEKDCMVKIGDPKIICKSSQSTEGISTEKMIQSTYDSTVDSITSDQSTLSSQIEEQNNDINLIKILVIVLVGLVGIILVGLVLKTVISLCMSRSNEIESREMNF